MSSEMEWSGEEAGVKLGPANDKVFGPPPLWTSGMFGKLYCLVLIKCSPKSTPGIQME